MVKSRTMVLAAAVITLAGVSAVEAGPFRDGPNSWPIFGRPIFGGRLFRPFQKQPTPTYNQPAAPASTEEPPLAAAPAPAVAAPAPATASAPLPVGPAAAPSK